LKVRLAFVWLVLALWVSGPSPLRAEGAPRSGEFVVDRIILEVGAAGAQGADIRIVTRYELEVEARLILAERSRSVESAGSDLSPRFLSVILVAITNQILMVDESTRLQLVTPSDQQLAAERDALEQRLGGPGSLARFFELTGAPPDLLEHLIWRRVVAEEFIRQNIRLAVSVTDEELEQAYQQGNHPFGQLPLPEIRGQLEAYILAQRQREHLEQWLGDVRRRSRIRVIEP